MDTEESLRAAIEADHKASGPRLIYADFLEEKGDPRAAGYRALGRLGRYPIFTAWTADYQGWSFERGGDNLSLRSSDGLARPNVIPTDWSTLVGNNHVAWAVTTRDKLEDYVALAFSYLPEERQQQLLNTRIEDI